MKLTKCPKCNKPIKWDYEAPYQEYPGARVWGGFYSAECDCGWEDSIEDKEGYNVQENKRGY